MNLYVLERKQWAPGEVRCMFVYADDLATARTLAEDEQRRLERVAVERRAWRRGVNPYDWQKARLIGEFTNGEHAVSPTVAKVIAGEDDE